MRSRACTTRYPARRCASSRSLGRAGLDSVRAFARREIDSGRPLDSLVNNAGVMATAKRMSTIDGFELQFGTNVLGHLALPALLLPTLDAAAIRDERPRIVTVASIAHKSGRIGFEDLQSQHGYWPMVAYRQSKLAILMIAFELARRLHAMGSRVMSVAAYPGVASTNLFRGEHFVAGPLAQIFLNGFIGSFLNSDADGALPTLYAATAPAVADGGYYGPLGVLDMQERPWARRRSRPRRATRRTHGGSGRHARR
jgi:NAD(P)-dependent dehydrogenase (short-subunit alcohol dehydrogenase family)